MTDNVLTLARKPGVAAVIKDDIVCQLRNALERAERGELEAIVVLMKHTNRHWSWLNSGSLRFPEMVGMLEIQKSEWIASYLSKDDAPAS